MVLFSNNPWVHMCLYVCTYKTLFEFLIIVFQKLSCISHFSSTGTSIFPEKPGGSLENTLHVRDGIRTCSHHLKVCRETLIHTHFSCVPSASSDHIATSGFRRGLKDQFQQQNCYIILMSLEYKACFLTAPSLSSLNI